MKMAITDNSKRSCNQTDTHKSLGHHITNRAALLLPTLALSLTMLGTAYGSVSEYDAKSEASVQLSDLAATESCAAEDIMLARGDVLPRQYAELLHEYRSMMNNAEDGPGPEPAASQTYEDNPPHFNGKWYCHLEMWEAKRYNNEYKSYGYCLKDIDHNGIPELIIGCNTEENYGSGKRKKVTRIVAMYTISGSKAQPLLYGWGRCPYFLNSDATRIIRRASGSWSDTSICLYRLTDSQLRFVTGVCSAGNPNDHGVSYYKLREDVPDGKLPKEWRISKAFFEERLASYTKNLRLLQLTPIFQ